MSPKCLEKVFCFPIYKKMHLFQKATTHLKWPLRVLYFLTQTKKIKSASMLLPDLMKPMVFWDTPEVSRGH